MIIQLQIKSLLRKRRKLKEFKKKLKREYHWDLREIEEIKKAPKTLDQLKESWEYQQMERLKREISFLSDEQLRLMEQNIKLKIEKAEIVESLANLEGFRGIKALVSGVKQNEIS